MDMKWFKSRSMPKTKNMRLIKILIYQNVKLVTALISGKMSQQYEHNDTQLSHETDEIGVWAKLHLTVSAVPYYLRFIETPLVRRYHRAITSSETPM